MWRSVDNGFQRTSSTGIDHFRGSAHVVQGWSLTGVHVRWRWRMIRRRVLQVGRCLMVHQQTTRQFRSSLMGMRRITRIIVYGLYGWRIQWNLGYIVGLGWRDRISGSGW